MGTGTTSAEERAQSRVNAFLMQLNTPCPAKATKKIKYSSQIQTVHAANNRLHTNTANTNTTSNKPALASDTATTAPPRSALQPLRIRHAPNAVASKGTKNIKAQNISKATKRSVSPPAPVVNSAVAQSTLDQYSLSLQMKNAE